MLFIWLTICNKKGTARDLCTIPLSSIIYYTIIKKISTTTYYHPILWHRIRCTSRHTHTLYMPACPLPILGLFLHRDELFLPALVYSCNFHHKYLHDLLHSNHQFPNLFHTYYIHYASHTVAHHMQPLPPLSHNVPLPCAEWYWPHTLPIYGYTPICPVMWYLMLQYCYQLLYLFWCLHLMHLYSVCCCALRLLRYYSLYCSYCLNCSSLQYCQRFYCQQTKMQ